MNDLKFAIPAALLFCTLALLLFMYGSHVVQVTVGVALFSGALSQFVAQDQYYPVVQTIALALAYLAIGLAALALIVFAVA